jgi:hypothetical protein
MSDATLLEAVIIAPVAKHTATVIFVHGLDDSGHGWKPVGDVLVSAASVLDLWKAERAEHAGMVRLNLHGPLV